MSSNRNDAPPIPDELAKICTRMRLPYLRKAAPDVLATARAQRWDPAEVVRALLHEEVVGRDAATRRMRRKSANFPTGKTFSSWRPEESSIPEATQNALMTLEWIHRRENLAISGASGTGKRATSSKRWRTRRSKLTCGCPGSPSNPSPPPSVRRKWTARSPALSRGSAAAI